MNDAWPLKTRLFRMAGERPTPRRGPPVDTHDAGRLELISDDRLARGVACTPVDDYVIWTGLPFAGRDASRRALVLDAVTQAWRPVSVRELVRCAARLSGQRGVPPERARAAIKMHQAASGASYLLVRRTGRGDFVAITDIPMPVMGCTLRPGDLVLAADGARFTDRLAQPQRDTAVS